jgi:exopolyphosphatase/guanosine-5'-triphosphate,3'-diphosphate pyrophosphatase
MRCACIDIGSNTTRLLVAEPTGGGLRAVLNERVFTLLGRHDGRIPPGKLAEVADTVAAQVEAARAAGALVVRAVATAAVRQAANGDELCAAVRTACGVEVAVLSGEEEARLAFLGATGTLARAPAGTVAVVDVGGASTELVCGTAEGGVEWSVSVPIGSGSLTAAELAGDPPGERELAAARARAARALAGVRAPCRLEAAYAVGGSATSLWRLLGPVLDRETLARGVRELCSAPCAEAADRLGLHPERVRMLPAGILVLDAAGTLLGVPLRIGAGGLREGVVLEQLGRGAGAGPATSARP